MARVIPISLAAATLFSFGTAQAGSLRFDGVDDSIVVSDAMNLPGALTLEAWVYVEGATNGGRIISNRQGQNGYELLVRDGGVGEPEFWLVVDGGLEIIGAFPRSLFSTWAHVAFTYDGPTAGNMKLFLNGAQAAASVRHTTITTSPGPLRIGSIGDGLGFHFHGGIDEVRIWSAALSGQVLADWKNAAVIPAHPNYAALEGYWRFEETGGQTAASQVNTPARDATLGLQTGADSADPAWWETGVAAMPSTFGLIKAGMGRSRR